MTAARAAGAGFLLKAHLTDIAMTGTVPIVCFRCQLEWMIFTITCNSYYYQFGNVVKEL